MEKATSTTATLEKRPAKSSARIDSSGSSALGSRCRQRTDQADSPRAALKVM